MSVRVPIWSLSVTFGHSSPASLDARPWVACTDMGADDVRREEGQ